MATDDKQWRGRLPAGGQATPMSCVAGVRQFLLIAAGNHGSADSTLSDHPAAFALL